MVSGQWPEGSMTGNEAKRLARRGCIACGGSGVCVRAGICACVWRAAYRVCLERYLEYRVGAALEGREFCADFETVGRRELGGKERAVWEWSIRRGERWSERALRMQVERGTFFHALERAQVRLGRVYAEAALWPLEGYFTGFGGATHNKEKDRV